MNPFSELQFEITHKCNKHCAGCNHRISTSPMPDMSIGDLDYVLSRLSAGDTDEIDTVELIGGEPLMHDHFCDLVYILDIYFSDHVRIKIITNGRLMPTVPKSVFDRCDWWVSKYPGWNDEIFQRYAGVRNVNLGSTKDWSDCEQNPCHSEEAAQAIKAKCPYKRVRIFGRWMYGCCMAENNERAHGLYVGCEFTEKWREDWLSLPTEKACSVCYLSSQYL